MVKRKTYEFKKNGIIEVNEYHDGCYGAPGKSREEKKKPTPEEMQIINHRNKVDRCRHRLLEYFTAGDTFAVWTYAVKNRPADMETALKHFQAAMRKVREAYRKEEEILHWIRNIEQGTRGAWHIHLIVREIGNTASILKEAWPYGGTYAVEIRLSDQLYDEDFTKLAEYMTKDHNSGERKKDGSLSKPRVRQSSYGTSRNMPLKEPKVKKLKRWKDEPKPKKGYVLIRVYEGINPATGFKYRRYTMIRLREGPAAGQKRRE